MAHEYHGIVYDTKVEQLAKLLEAIRQRQKQDDPFRITVTWISGEFRPYSGYIVMTEPTKLTEWDKAVSTPLLAWNRRSTKGKRLDPALIESITYASSKMQFNRACPHLYLRDNNYFAPDSYELISNAIF